MVVPYQHWGRSCLFCLLCIPLVIDGALVGHEAIVDAELCGVVFSIHLSVLMRDSFSCDAVLAPVSKLCMMQLVRQDHCLRGCSRPPGDSGVPCGDLFLFDVLTSSRIIFPSRSNLARLLLPGNSRRTN